MDELIPVSKDSDYLEVHPTALVQHKRLGWKECERQVPALLKKPAKKADEQKAD